MDRYVDSNYSIDLDRRKSLSGYLFKFAEECLSWKDSLQHVVALSFIESKHAAIVEAIKEELGFTLRTIMVYCDN